jgi:hypothetical protein
MTEEYLEVEMKEGVELTQEVTKLGEEPPPPPSPPPPSTEQELKQEEWNETNSSLMLGTKLAIFNDPLYLKAENRRDKVVFSMVVFLKQILAALGSKCVRTHTQVLSSG